MLVTRPLQRGGHVGDQVVPADVIFTCLSQVEERQKRAAPLLDPVDLEKP